METNLYNIAEIARKTGLSWRLVKSYLSGKDVKPYVKTAIDNLIANEAEKIKE